MQKYYCFKFPNLLQDTEPFRKMSSKFWMFVESFDKNNPIIINKSLVFEPLDILFHKKKKK